MAAPEIIALETRGLQLADALASWTVGDLTCEASLNDFFGDEGNRSFGIYGTISRGTEEIGNVIFSVSLAEDGHTIESVLIEGMDMYTHGAGQGAIALAAIARGARMIGINELELYAADAGAYAWARLGAQARAGFPASQKDAAQRLTADIHSNLDHACAAGLITDAQAQQARALLLKQAEQPLYIDVQAIAALAAAPIGGDTSFQRYVELLNERPRRAPRTLGEVCLARTTYRAIFDAPALMKLAHSIEQMPPPLAPLHKPAALSAAPPSALPASGINHARGM